MYDWVIRNGTVVDGTGRPGFLADVAFTDGVITDIGPDLGPGREELDATGKIVTPGWVDMHTHYDGQATWDPHLSPSGWHGVTTVVMGNCGVGFAPCRKEDREWLLNVMEGVEDIPGAALAEGIQWDWESFPEYLDALEKHPHSLDYATQIPHSAVRGFVMGQDSSEEQAATPEQILQMKEIVKEGLLAGALGFSTSRTTLHKTQAGQFVAGTFAEHDELFGIGEALRETGLGVFECANEHVTMGKDIEWMEALANQISRPVIFSLAQTDFAPDLWKDILAKLEQAVERGAPLQAQVAGRAIGIVMNWRITAHPFTLHPVWQRLAELPWEEHLAALKKPEIKQQILADTPEQRGVFEHYVTTTFDKMYFLSRSGYEPAPEESVAAMAAARGVSPAELAYDLMMEQEGRGMLYFPLFNYADGSLEMLHTLHQHASVLMGLSDGGAHCGAICDGGMPTFMLTHWTRDRTRGERLGLEYVVHRQTQQTARFYGMEDRGVLAAGYRADINVIDYDGLTLGPAKVTFDLPAGGRRLIQRATGYQATFCAGVLTHQMGTPTGAMPGKLVRGPQSQPEDTRLESFRNHGADLVGAVRANL